MRQDGAANRTFDHFLDTEAPHVCMGGVSNVAQWLVQYLMLLGGRRSDL